MSEFLNTVDQNSRISKIFEAAKKEILIISPFIKLHQHSFK